MRGVDEQKLFVAPGGYVGQPLGEALDQYVEEIKRWRSKASQEMLLALPKGGLLLNGLMERLAPHYHLLENAAELSASPLFALEASWHYYTVLSKFFAARLRAQGAIGAEAVGASELVGEREHRWLGNVPVNHLIHLLSRRENEGFRVELNALVSELRDATVAGLDSVVTTVCRGVASLLNAHDLGVQAIQKKYEARYGGKTVASYVTAGAAYLPALAPIPRIQCQSGTHSDPQSEMPRGDHESANSLLGALGVAPRN